MGKTELLITIIIFNLFFASFVIAVLVYIRKYRMRKTEYDNEIKINNEIHQKELLSTQLEIQKETMQQIGRELHDNIGQKMTLASLYSQQLIYENPEPKITEKIGQINDIIKQSIKDLRGLSRSLTSDIISQNDIVFLIQEEVNNTNELKKCNVLFRYTANEMNLTAMQKNVVLRITQEFIQNSMKHSECDQIDIDLFDSEQVLMNLSIKDNGIGFDENETKSDGIGLVNMKNRAKIIGAEFILKSAPNKGTSILMELKK